ncbi:LOW QUALITY PROTEIN: uncharacterized protein [Atheta coriaria]|uniref:LOW QUALITY PROTEIN: uncharacterized protein n=1 Tax=Dalotia coriaria TaxID=877792 RepID=UPI0031F36FF7
MAPTEDSNSETADDSLSPAAEKRNSLNNKFRAQYHKLHRSKSLTGNVESLRSRFEEVQVEPEEKQGPKPKISLVNKADFKVEVKSEVEEDKSIPIPKKRLSKVPVAVPVPENKQVEEKPKEPLKKSVSIEVDTVKEEKKEKRVSFSFESKNDSPPVPKPRVSLPITQVIVETTVIEPEKVSQVETVIINEPPTPINLDQIDFAAPEDRHLVTRYDDFEVGSVENIKRALDVFTMEPKKKRSPSFRSKLMTIFSKDKDKKPKDKEDTKKTKKTENAVFADNAQNENFNRHSTQRHTIDTPRRDPKSLPANHQQSFHDAMHPDQRMDLEHRYAAMHIQNFQQARNSFEAHQNQQQLMRKLPPDHGVYNPSEDYVCMDNKNDSKNYINVPKYDSSSTNTIESENSTTSVNPLQQLQQERLAIRSKFFNETGTPPRAQETNQNVQLIHPKAAIPINSERPLPNPFQQSQPSPQQRNESPYQLQQQPQRLQDENDLADSGYGTVYDRNSRPMSAGSSDISAGSMNGPRSPSVERTKLRLPQNREKVELQPRLRSPIPPSEVSTDKLIATELLKTNKKNDKKDRSSPSHQKLQLEIDYPELHETICDVVDQTSTNQNQNELSITSFNKNDVSSSSFNVTDNNTNGNMTDNEISRSTLLEAGDWHRVQRDLASSPSLKNVQITTNALVHVDSPHRANTPSQDGRSRSITPNMMVRRNSNTSLQRSPPKQEIRQNVEAFCWKELKKLKEQEEQQMQRLVGPMISSCGYAEDPIRRSRSMAVTPRDTRRSSSLPREIRQRRVDDIELNARRMAQQQRFNTGPQRGGDGQTRPIFNRGSLTQQNAIDQPIYSKKVSFRSHNTQNNTAWPTKNGFTQSPPQRRLDADSNGVTGRESLEDDVFLPPEGGPPSRDEIFLLNQQRQKELLLAKAQRSNAPVSTIDSGTASVVDSASVISEVPPMRTIREPIYAARPPMQSQIPNKVMNENIYGSRGPHNEPIYGSRNGGMPRINEGAYNGNMVRNEEPYGTRQANESIYGSRPSHNEPIYTSRPAPPPSRSMTESPYGSRMYPNGMPQRDESIYGSKSSNMVPESVYGTRGSVQREPIYGSRQIQPPRMESPYGTMQNGQRYLPGYPPPGHQEPVYGSRPHLQAHPHFHPQNTEEIYGYRRGSGSVRSESPYGARPPIPNQQYYNRPRLSPSSIGPPLPQVVQEEVPCYQLKRSNSLRQPVSPESLYGGRPNFNKPPSGVQYRQRQIDLSPPGQRYDLPPGDSLPRQQEPIYGTRKINTVNNKVCDIYGNIYDANKQTPLSPPPLQKAGVLYGQLQRNSNAQPVAYQSHQQLQPNNNFQRGTRLTASVNDMHRYNSNGNMGQITQRTEPPSRPLPPIPDEQQKKSRFGFGRKNKNESGKEEEWNSDGKRGGLSGSESGGRSDTDGDLRSRSRNNRRDDPRRHTLAGEQYGTMSGQGGPLSRTMDLEHMSSSRLRKVKPPTDHATCFYS